MAPFLAELIGTFLLILLGNGVVANVLLKETKGNNSGWIVITTGWALAVFVGVSVAGPYSGAHLNPAVTVGLALAGKFETILILPYVIAQMLGAILGALAVYIFYKPHYDITEDEGLKHATFCTSPAIRNFSSNYFSEALGTFVLVFVVLYFTAPEISIVNQQTELFGLGSLGAIPVAFLVWVIGLSLGGTTGYAINPARDLGPRIVHQLLPFKMKSDWQYAWVPVLGPIAGATVAGFLFLVFN